MRTAHLPTYVLWWPPLDVSTGGGGMVSRGRVWGVEYRGDDILPCDQSHDACDVTYPLPHRMDRMIDRCGENITFRCGGNEDIAAVVTCFCSLILFDTIQIHSLDATCRVQIHNVAYNFSWKMKYSKQSRLSEPIVTGYGQQKLY